MGKWAQGCVEMYDIYIYISLYISIYIIAIIAIIAIWLVYVMIND